MSTYDLRLKLLEIARLDRNKVEVTKNQAPWIAKLWPATTYPNGMENREPYCAAGVAYCVKQWLLEEEVREALGFTTVAQGEKWRCKSASVYKADDSWLNWAKKTEGVTVLPKTCILHAGDLAVYSYSHIEMVTDDDNTTTGAFLAIGYNTDKAGSADGEGCYEKPRNRAKIKNFIRLLA
jgi:hypothetical protein